MQVGISINTLNLNRIELGASYFDNFFILFAFRASSHFRL